MEKEEDERMWIHMDLVVEILSRMPVKSLMKFKCLSKELSRIIHSRNFIDSCLSCSSTSRSRLLFFFRYHEINTLVFYSAPHLSTCAIAPTRHDMILRGGVDVSFTSPPVRGLMLCAIGHNQLFICNPATRQTIGLPQNLMLVERDNLTELLVLGYDPIFDQFKVLCIWGYPNARPSTYVQFWVLTVGQDGNMWRKIQGMPHLYPGMCAHTCGQGGICINGVLYFKAYSWTPSRHHPTITMHVVSFDLNTEVFSLVKTNDHVNWFSKLIDFQGKLAFISRVNMDCTVEFCILENKEEWSSKVFHLPWTQSYSKDYMRTSQSVLGIHDGDIVFTPQGELGCTWHLSLEKRTVRKVVYEIPITKPYPLAVFFANHFDTAVSIL